MAQLEDQFQDILNKAKRGLNLSNHDIAQKTGLKETIIDQLCQGRLTNVEDLKKVASCLCLDADALLAIAQNQWKPKSVHIEGLKQFQSDWSDMKVNAYLIWQQSNAIAFDTGADAQEMLDFLKKHSLRLSSIFITHTHGDHIFELDRLKESTQAEAWVCENESIPGAKTFKPNHIFSINPWKIETGSTPGHSPGGTTYIVQGFTQPIAFVGDALFAGSMGGASANAYEQAWKNNRDKILTLPNPTILCPGHGPITTVEEEKRHNPFFASAFIES